MKKQHPYRKEEQATASTRRAFLKSAAAVAVTSDLLTRTGHSAPAGDGKTAKPTLFAPAGELGLRIKMTQDRLTKGGVPSFSMPFILADVSLDPAYPRRFANYSGDLSGRYIGALSLLPAAEGTTQLDSLVRRVSAFQRADGRFGAADLSFVAQKIDREQMALLWGNGRLLVGLLEYNSVHPDAAVLATARRLAEFLLKVQESCSRSEVMKRLVGQGASGFICFTQLIEAFTLLGMQTGERRYLDAASGIIPWLQPRGNQHSHGYLTTLRGIAQLYRATGRAEQLRYVENAYRDLLSSPDYTIYGGVFEYFGNGPGGAGAEDMGRDEGCSEADFLRLSLQLWQATGRIEYLEKAERCLLNEFFFNQFNTGDFGHHTSWRCGYRPTESVGRAWWCCTMHGLRAFRDILDSVVTTENDLIRVNLFLDGAWSGKPLSLDLSEAVSSEPGNPPQFRIAVRESSSDEVSIAVRQPSWIAQYSLRLNGSGVASRSTDGYAVVRRKWRKGDLLEVALDYSLHLETRSGQVLDPSSLGAQPIEAALFCGPHLLAADSGSEPAYFGEPWMGNSSMDSNVILLRARVDHPVHSAESGTPLSKPSARRRFEYIHGGWPDRHSVTLRPISEQTASEPQVLATWLRCREA